MISIMALTASSQRIHKLSTALANQIAAGEVIERPASVVKELLENSLDAGATEIKLDVRKGGRSLISIQDNGAGIHSDDLPLALAQHATSKLTTQSDLETIRTLGFRGEALSSIASVSRFKLSSRIENQEHGWSIDAAEMQETPVGMSTGTHVEVRDLFFNTPARRKFLRTDNTEFFHIREIVRRMALSRHDVSFHLKHNEKTILQCSGYYPDLKAEQQSEIKQSIAERVQAILGKAFIENAYEVNCERNGLRLWGWFGQPQIARNQLDQQYFYLNGRVIRDKRINHALRMVTQGHFYPGKHAVYVLFLEMDTAQVDVNVHPAKYEVRFRQARDVHDFIFSVLQQSFAEHGVHTNPNAIADGQHDNTQNRNIQEQGAQYSFPQEYSSNSFASDSVKSYAQHSNSKPGHHHYAKLSSASNESLLIENRYLIMQIDGDTYLFDVPLCKEIIALSKLEKDVATGNEEQGIRRRPLLVPLTMSVTVDEGKLIENKLSELESFGLKLERLTPDSLFIREIPLHLEYADITQLINDMLPLIKAGKSNSEIIRMMAGHANDAGLNEIDSAAAIKIMGELDQVKSGIAAQLKQHAWRKIDGEMLMKLLKKSI